jgi:hypothetical protein
MEPQERDLITTLLTRLQSAGSAGQPKDAEADQLIRQAMTQMPDAPYYLVQTVLIQDLSLHNAQNRIAELEKQVASLPPPQQQQPTSFLGGLFGRSQNQSAAAPSSGPSVPQGGGPWSRVQQPAAPPPQYAQPGYAQPGYAQPAAGGVFGAGAGAGGGFLRSAAATAAGVAGGALLFEGISSLFGHNYASGLGGFGGMGGGMPGGLGETVINNYNGDSQGGSDGGYAGGDGGYAGGGGDGGYAGGDSGGGGGGGGGDGGGYDGGGDSGGGWDSGGGDDGGGDSGGGDSLNC